MAKGKELEKSGKLTPKTLKAGPSVNRRCTDILFLLIFLGFWVGVVMIGSYAYKNVEDSMSITYVYDQYGEACKGDYPALFFIYDTTTTFKMSNTVCVKSCPTSITATLECSPSMPSATCSSLTAYPSTLIINRFCWPDEPTTRKVLQDLEVLSTGFIMRTVADLKVTWGVIIGVGVVALLLGLIYLFLLKLFSGIIIWIVLLLSVLLTSGFGYVCLSYLNPSLNHFNVVSLFPTFMETWSAPQIKIVAIVSIVLGLISFLLICCSKRRINLSLAVLRTATHFVAEELEVLWVPVIFLIKGVAFFALWIPFFILIVETNEIKPDENHNPIPEIKWNVNSVAMMLYYLFGLLWNHAFGVALSQFILASTVCLWYFRKGSKDQGSYLLTSLKRAILHMGSVAFGSFLISVLSFARLILGYLHAKLSQAPVPGQEALEKGYCLVCCQCFLTCFEKSLRFLTEHAYIQIAMTGESFCQATEDAFYLLTRNAGRFGLVGGLAWTFALVGQIFITATSTFAGYYYITTHAQYSRQIYSPISPSIFFFLISFLIGKVIMGVYEISSNTIIHCFAMDEEINDGAAEHAPSQLREFVDNHHKTGLLANK